MRARDDTLVGDSDRAFDEALIMGGRVDAVTPSEERRNSAAQAPSTSRLVWNATPAGSR